MTDDQRRSLIGMVVAAILGAAVAFPDEVGHSDDGQEPDHDVQRTTVPT